MFSLLLKELIFIVICGHYSCCCAALKLPRTSSIIQFIFYVWSFEFIRNFLRKIRKDVGLTLKCSRQNSAIRNPIRVYISLWIDCVLETQNYSMLSYQSMQGHAGSELIIRNRSVFPIFFLLNVFMTLKATNFYNLFVVTTAGTVS